MNAPYINNCMVSGDIVSDIKTFHTNGTTVIIFTINNEYYIKNRNTSKKQYFKVKLFGEKWEKFTFNKYDSILVEGELEQEMYFVNKTETYAGDPIKNIFLNGKHITNLGKKEKTANVANVDEWENIDIDKDRGSEWADLDKNGGGEDED